MSFSLVAFQFLLKDRKGKTLVEEYDKYENTPLHVAAKKGYVRIVQVSRPLFSVTQLEVINESLFCDRFLNAELQTRNLYDFEKSPSRAKYSTPNVIGSCL